MIDQTVFGKSRLSRIGMFFALLLIACQTVLGQTTQPHLQFEGLVRVGMTVYAGGKSGLCFSNGFLADIARRTQINVTRRFEPIPLADDGVFNYPFMVMSGTGPFELSSDELDHLKAYLTRGGFLLASAGCSNKAWAASFQEAVRQLFPDHPLEPLKLDHPLFHTIYNITRLPTRKPTDEYPLWGLRLGDRLVLVYSPLGLNDTARAGGGCCCCGGNELRNAALVNANVLAYALTH